MKRFFPVVLSALCLILIGVMAHGALPVVETILQDVWDSTNHTLKLEINQEAITGALSVGDDITLENDETIGNAVDGTIALTGIVDISESLEFNGFFDSPYQAVAASSYTLNAASKAMAYVVNYTDTGAVSFILGTAAVVDGRVVTIKDGELNANTNNITISTEASETIDEAATYVMDADGESVTLTSDGTNWFVTGAYLE